MVLVTGSFSPREGGAERQLRSVLADLARQGATVAVVTQVMASRKLKRVETIEGIRVYRVGSRWAFRFLPPIAHVVFLVCALLVALWLRPSALVSLQMGAASIAAALAARICGARHYLRLTGGGSEKFRSEPMARAAKRSGRIATRLYSTPNTTVLAPARHLLADFAEAFPDMKCSTRFIPNGVSLPSGTVAKTADVIWYSRAGSQQSADQFEHIVDLLPDVSFTVIGRYEPAHLRKNVLALGWQESPESVIGRHRVIVNTSPAEGMPNTILQALAWGCRAVAFDNAGTKELAAAYPEAVSLVNPGDYRAAAAAVSRALAEKAAPATPEVVSSEQARKIWQEMLLNKEEVLCP